MSARNTMRESHVSWPRLRPARHFPRRSYVFHSRMANHAVTNVFVWRARLKNCLLEADQANDLFSV
jgi:hypothetical protein